MDPVVKREAGRMRRVLAALRHAYAPDGKIRTALSARGPFRLLVAVLLSAQCTDKSVNRVLPSLFRAYPDPRHLARARPSDLERVIQSLGLFRTKSRHLVSLARLLVERHNGKVPRDLDALVKLPGVGRKTALVTLAHAFGIAPGIAIDTHAGRIARRLGFSRAASPERVEKDLLPLVPPSSRGEITNLLIAHGRALCRARAPLCGNCFLAPVCPYPREKRGRY